MRIVAGSKRGLTLFTPDTTSTRPTLDRVRENIFNLIQFDIYGKRVLDLFSGSGAMGIEALSRGAEFSTFSDNDKNAINIIEKNIDKADFNDKSIIKKSDFSDFLTTTDDKFDIIFLDPPYHKGYIESSLKLILKNNLLNEGGLIVCEFDLDENFDFSRFEILKEKKYGRVRIAVLKYMGKDF